MSEVAELSAREAAARIAEFCLVDVRQETEWNGPLGRVAGARLVPLGELAQRVAELPRDRALLMICRSGARSARACAQLAQLGFARTVNLAGGMIAWNRASLPVERTPFASRAAVLESAVAWLAQVTGQPVGAAAEKVGAQLGAGAPASPTREQAARALDAIAALAGAPPDLDLSIAAFRAALAEL